MYLKNKLKFNFKNKRGNLSIKGQAVYYFYIVLVLTVFFVEKGKYIYDVASDWLKA